MKKLFFNGNIITLNNDKIVDSILIEEDTIIKVGEYSDCYVEDAEKINLEGKTMIPSFIDSHSHFTQVANSFLQVDLNGCTSFKDIQDKIKEFLDRKTTNDVIIASGYDHNILKEQKHPNIEFLDSISNNIPIILMHKSGHVGVFNSKVFELLNINENSNIAGGVYGIENGKLNGYVEENAFIQNLRKMPMTGLENFLEAFKDAQNIYLSNGITTVQEGMFVKEMIPIYKYLLDSTILKLDLIGYTDIKDKDLYKNTFSQSYKKYHNNFKIGGFKIFLDGSPQGKTAWMKTDYINDPGNKGYPILLDTDVYKNIEYACKTENQIIVHCNGDAAIEQYINQTKEISKIYDISKIRPVIIHAQLMGLDQLEDVAKLKMIPSYFVAHVYHWGDIHIKNFGFERASHISPLKSSLNKNILFTLHQDAPVIAPNMIETISCAVNRVTKDGIILGEDEKISCIDALKAVTKNAAYQYFEEDIKGSIEVGKKANLVILSENILEIAPKDITNIKVLETIKDGKTVFKL